MDSGAANRLRRNVVRQLGLRAIVNLVTGADVTVLLLALGIDFPLMWGVLAFVLTFIPWSGLPLAVAPAVVLALAEYGLDRALLIIAGVIVINILAESALSPMLMGRGLSLSPTVLFLGFIFWARLLGGPGAFLAVPLLLSVIVLILYTFPETRWLASVMGASSLAPMPLTSNLLLLMVLLLRLLLSMVLSPRQKSSALNEHQCTTRDRGR